MPIKGHRCSRGRSGLVKKNESIAVLQRSRILTQRYCALALFWIHSSCAVVVAARRRQRNPIVLDPNSSVSAAVVSTERIYRQRR